MTDLDDALADLRRSMENFATAYVASVARMLDRELRIATPMVDLEPSGRMTKVKMACPNTAEHPRHVWSFPKSTQSRQCPGVPTPRLSSFPEEACLKTDAHAPHDWERAAEASTGTLGRHCRGSLGVLTPVVPTERQCPDNLAHHVHTWWRNPETNQRDQPCTPASVKHECPGLETDLEARWCASRPYDHAAHVWNRVDVEDPMFCRGFREVPVKRCREDRTHLPHNWQDDTDKVAACPGRARPWDTNVVPAGPDRHA